MAKNLLSVSPVVEADKTEPLPPVPLTTPVVPESVSPAPSTPPVPDEVTLRLLDRINYSRQSAGLPVLVLNSQLTLAAQRHSRAMAERDFFGHVDRDGKSVGLRVEATGYRGTELGECIAAGEKQPERVVVYWLNRTPQYRRILIDPAFNEIGIGYTYLPGDTGAVRHEHYWTVVLGRR
jgi:uncharacterized protein YkwD